ncbi:hypothetical protein M3Y99_01331300 [Aphelenchoides fujianensis]|nr:hypothetical protein M3Y99_01331300 [Aphelenchoides fujianensis]
MHGIFTSVLLAAFLPAVWSAESCPFKPFNVGGNQQCGSGYTLKNGQCCHNDTPGGTGRYCDVPARLDPPLKPKCPSTHPYEQSSGMCCGPTPITPAQRQQAAANAAAQANGGQNPLGAAGGTAGCVDKAPPGRPSDCAANANLCNNTLYYTLMTEQCPATCGRCNLVQNTQAAGTANANCRDGTNAAGVSECPQNAFKCNLPVWRPFMMKECPVTCNACPTVVTPPIGSGAAPLG